MSEAPTGDPPSQYTQFVGSQLNNTASTTGGLIGIGPNTIGTGTTFLPNNPSVFSPITTTTNPNWTIGGGPYDFKPSAKVREKLYYEEYLTKKEREVWERSCVEIFHGAKVAKSTKVDIEGIERIRAYIRILEAEIIRENKKDEPSSGSS